MRANYFYRLNIWPASNGALYQFMAVMSFN